MEIEANKLIRLISQVVPKDDITSIDTYLMVMRSVANIRLKIIDMANGVEYSMENLEKELQYYYNIAKSIAMT